MTHKQDPQLEMEMIQSLQKHLDRIGIRRIVISIDWDYMMDPHLRSLRGRGIHYRYGHLYRGEDVNGHLKGPWHPAKVKIGSQDGYLGTLDQDEFVKENPKFRGFFIGLDLNIA